MSTPTERMNGLGRLTTRTLLDELTELREDIQAQTVILAEMDQTIRNLFAEMRRANILRYRPTAKE